MQPELLRLNSFQPDDAPEGNVVCVIPFDGLECVASDLSSRDPIALPDPLMFTAYFELLDTEAGDYPSNDRRWPIMSHAMLDVIRAVGQVEIGTRRAWLIDDLILDPGEPFDTAGNPIPGRVRTEYAVVQSVPSVDLIDWEQSSYRDSSLFPDRYKFEDMVLKHSDALPPLFRIHGVSALLFISPECGAACERAELKGGLVRPPGPLFPNVPKLFRPV